MPDFVHRGVGHPGKKHAMFLIKQIKGNYAHHLDPDCSPADSSPAKKSTHLRHAPTSSLHHFSPTALVVRHPRLQPRDAGNPGTTRARPISLSLQPTLFLNAAHCIESMCDPSQASPDSTITAVQPLAANTTAMRLAVVIVECTAMCEAEWWLDTVWFETVEHCLAIP